MEFVDVPDEILSVPAPVYSRQQAYLRVSRNGTYTFQFTSTNVGFRLRINGNTVIDAFLNQSKLSSTVSIVLQNAWIHNVSVEMVSLSNSSRTLSLQWKRAGEAEFYPIDTLFYNYKGRDASVIGTEF